MKSIEKATLPECCLLSGSVVLPAAKGMRTASALLIASLCLGACVMDRPQRPIDTHEYRLDSDNFPIRNSVERSTPTIEPTIREDRLAVMIEGVAEELEILLVTPPSALPMPLALISHGISASDQAAGNMNLRRLLPVAENFARRGYFAVVFARRGYGSSTGTVGDRPYKWCGFWPSEVYAHAARESAKDYEAVMRAMLPLPEVDGSRIVAVGHSGGGLAALAFAAQRHPGLTAVVNFAGGTGATGNYSICSATALRRAFSDFGRMVQIPSLWLYSTADRYFWPSLARRNFDAYVAGGAPARLEMVGPLWSHPDGHQIHALGGREFWQPRISAFLRDIDAPGWQLDPTSASVPRPPPPDGLPQSGQQAWLEYAGSSGHKAFVIGVNGWYWIARQSSAREAENIALATCREYTEKCQVVAAD